MVELVDSVDLGSTAKSVQVRVLLPAPVKSADFDKEFADFPFLQSVGSARLFCQCNTKQYNPNQIFPVGDGFGLFVFFGMFEETHFRNGVIKRPESTPRGPGKRGGQSLKIPAF